MKAIHSGVGLKWIPTWTVETFTAMKTKQKRTFVVMRRRPSKKNTDKQRVKFWMQNFELKRDVSICDEHNGMLSTPVTYLLTFIFSPFLLNHKKSRLQLTLGKYRK